MTLDELWHYPIWLKRYQQADLAVGRLCEVASEELEDGEDDDPDGDEDGEEDPVKLVEEPQVGFSLHDKASLSKANEENPEEEVEEQGVEVDAADDGPCELSELAPELGVLSVPEQTSLDLDIYNS